jgi:hypothetical protein
MQRVQHCLARHAVEAGPLRELACEDVRPGELSVSGRHDLGEQSHAIDKGRGIKRKTPVWRH